MREWGAAVVIVLFLMLEGEKDIIPYPGRASLDINQEVCGLRGCSALVSHQNKNNKQARSLTWKYFTSARKKDFLAITLLLEVAALAWRWCFYVNFKFA